MVENEVVAISKFKATCLALLDKVKRTGQPILVTKRGEPIALISSPPEPERPATWIGSFRSKGRIVGDVISPVSDESEWEVLKQ
jgi:prevent-host-death family protein